MQKRERVSFSPPASVDFDRTEIAFVVQHIWRGRSSLTNVRLGDHGGKFALTRFDRSKACSMDNLIFLRGEEADRHDAMTLATGSLPAIFIESLVEAGVYPAEALDAIKALPGTTSAAAVEAVEGEAAAPVAIAAAAATVGGNGGKGTGQRLRVKDYKNKDRCDKAPVKIPTVEDYWRVYKKLILVRPWGQVDNMGGESKQ